MPSAIPSLFTNGVPGGLPQLRLSDISYQQTGLITPIFHFLCAPLSRGPKRKTARFVPIWKNQFSSFKNRFPVRQEKAGNLTGYQPIKLNSKSRSILIELLQFN